MQPNEARCLCALRPRRARRLTWLLLVTGLGLGCVGASDPPGDELIAPADAGPAPAPVVYVDVAARDGLQCSVVLGDSVHCIAAGIESAVAGTSGATSVALGDGAGCAVRADGAIACFDTTDPTTPPAEANEVDGVAGAIDVSVGRGFGCWVDWSHVARCFALDARAPASIMIPEALDVAMTGTRVCALTGDAWTRCVDVATGAISPFQVGGGLALAGAPGRVVVMRGDGTVVEVGEADGRAPAVLATVPGGVEVAASGAATCARTAGRRVFCWRGVDRPTEVTGLAGASRLAAQDDRVCAVVGGVLACEAIGDPR